MSCRKVRFLKDRMAVRFVLPILGILALTGCGPRTFVVGLEPTPTLTPVPTPVVVDYVNRDYGFAFRYPETWTLAEEPRLATLSHDSLTLYIAYGWEANPGFRPLGGRTGLPAGELVYRDKIPFLGQPIPAHVLTYEQKDKMVIYGAADLVAAGDLVFSIWLEDTGDADYAGLDIPDDVQALVKQILASFERVAATGESLTPTAPSVPGGERDLITYTNDDYQLAFVYPSTWELEETSAGQDVTGGESAPTVYLTRDDLQLMIQFKRAGETAILGPTGYPAGGIEDAGMVSILGRPILKQAVVYEGKVKSIFLTHRFDDLEIYVQLEGGVGAGVDYAAVDLSAPVQVEVDAILGTLTRTGEPAAAEPDGLIYGNADYGFSFQYPTGWTVEEIEGETVEEGTRLADAVILRQGTFAIVVQYQLKSDPAQIAWGGRFVTGGMGYSEAVLGQSVTLLGEETHKLIWSDDDGIKAMAVNTTGKGADLLLSITLADGSVVVIQDPEAETIPESAVAALDQVLGSFAWTQ